MHRQADFRLGAKRMNRRSWVRRLGSFFDNRKSKIENLKWLGLSVIVFVLVVTGAVAQAQQPAKVPRIGYLTGPPLSASVGVRDAFRQGLHDLGYVEGKTLSSSGDLGKGNAIANARLLSNWCI